MWAKTKNSIKVLRNKSQNNAFNDNLSEQSMDTNEHNVSTDSAYGSAVESPLIGPQLISRDGKRQQPIDRSKIMTLKGDVFDMECDNRLSWMSRNIKNYTQMDDNYHNCNTIKRYISHKQFTKQSIHEFVKENESQNDLKRTQSTPQMIGRTISLSSIQTFDEKNKNSMESMSKKTTQSLICSTNGMRRKAGTNGQRMCYPLIRKTIVNDWQRSGLCLSSQPLPQSTQPLPQSTQPLPQSTQPLPQSTQPLPQSTQTDKGMTRMASNSQLRTDSNMETNKSSNCLISTKPSIRRIIYNDGNGLKSTFISTKPNIQIVIHNDDN